MADTDRVLRLFPTPVIIGEIGGAAKLNAELERAICERIVSEKGVAKSNVGGWHSKTDLFDWAGEASDQVAQRAIELANAHTLGPRGQPVSPRWRIAAWANVSGPRDSNAVHVHPAAYWSAVYYVRVSDGTRGHLLLHDPRMPALRMHAPALHLKDGGPEVIARIKPVEGRIVMFPSWVSHSVEPWDGESERISIALNLTAPLPPPPRGQRQPPA
jgi:uncharacterized protein (TIGR02466 family)